MSFISSRAPKKLVPDGYSIGVSDDCGFLGTGNRYPIVLL